MTPYSAGYRRTVVLLLTAAYTFNSMDRSIISILAPSIKADLRLTDMQLGLLGGTAFALLYGLGGLPIARLAERKNRVNIMTVALIAWSSLEGDVRARREFRAAALDQSGGRCRRGRMFPVGAFPDIRLCRAGTSRIRPLDIYLRHLARLHTRWRAGRICRAACRVADGLRSRGPAGRPDRSDHQGRRARAAAGRCGHAWRRCSWQEVTVSRARTAAILDTSRISRASCGRGCVAFRSPCPAHGARAHPRGLRCIRFLLLRPRLFSPPVRARFRLGRAHQRRLGRLGRGARDSRGRRSCGFPRALERSLVRIGAGHRRASHCRFMCSR